MKVFIVEDSALVRERIIAMISEHPGIEITGQAENAQEGINSIRKLKPDAVILDIRMPGGNGIEVLKNIKKNSFAPTVLTLAVFSLTSYPSCVCRALFL